MTADDRDRGTGPTQHPAQGGRGLAADVITQAVGQGLALGYQHLIIPQQRGDPAGTSGSGQSGKTGDTGYSSDEFLRS